MGRSSRKAIISDTTFPLNEGNGFLRFCRNGPLYTEAPCGVFSLNGAIEDRTLLKYDIGGIGTHALRKGALTEKAQRDITQKTHLLGSVSKVCESSCSGGVYSRLLLYMYTFNSFHPLCHSIHYTIWRHGIP